MSDFVAATTRETFREINNQYVRVFRPAAAALLYDLKFPSMSEFSS